MMWRPVRSLATLSAVLLTCLVPTSSLAAPAAPGQSPTSSHIPLYFEANWGQTDASVRFLLRAPGFSLFLTARGAVMTLRGPQSHPAGIRALPAYAPHVSGGHQATVNFLPAGMSRRVKISGLGALPGKVNYLLGSDPRAWHTNVPVYSGVEYRGVYPGIDLRFTTTSGGLEYVWVVHPGADPRKISVAMNVRSGSMRIDRHGNLVMSTAAGPIQQSAPRLYETVGGSSRRVTGQFVVRGNRASFHIGAYDPRATLVIDPNLTLLYSTYFGGNGDDEGNSVTAPGGGLAYFTGYTTSGNFPTKNAAQSVFGGDHDAFVAKINTNLSGAASLIYSTFLGGAGYDQGFDIAVDGSGDAYVTGNTESTNFPVTVTTAYQPLYGGIEDAFLSELNPAGNGLIYSTFLGGPQIDVGYGLALGPSGYVYVGGYTYSATFPTKNPLQPALNGPSDAFLAVFNTHNAGAASLVYSTFFGGSSFEYGTGVDVDSAGIVYLAGGTQSPDLPLKNAFQTTEHGSLDGFVAKISIPAVGASTLLYSTYFGGSGYENQVGLRADNAGNVYLSGWTQSTDYPVKNAFQSTFGGPYEDAYVTKISTTTAGAAGLLYSTYLGGASNDDGERDAIDSAGHVYIVGQTSSANFPTKSAYQSSLNGPADVFVSEIDPSATGAASLVFSTYLGGSNYDGGVGIAYADSAAYITGFTMSFGAYPAGYPTTPSAYQSSQMGNEDAFLTKLSFAPGSNTFGCSKVGVSASYNGTNTYYTSQGYTAGPEYTLYVNYTASGTPPYGTLTYYDARNGFTISVGYVTSVVSSGPKSDTVTIYGYYTQGGVTQTFTINVTGNSGVYVPSLMKNADVFQLQTSSGYDSGVVYQPAGSIVVSYAC